MKHIPLETKYFIVIFAAIFTFCTNEPCLDMAGLDRKMEDIKQWAVEESIGNTTIIDKYGMSQSLIVSNRYANTIDHIVEDECGNTYGSWQYTIQYNTSMLPLNFMIDISGSAIIADGFYMQLTITNTETARYRSTIYDFHTHQSRDRVSEVTYHEQFNISEQTFDGVLEIEFRTFAQNDVKTVFYAKKYGIIRFEQLNGNVFDVRF
jgi:hypothetical protein